MSSMKIFKLNDCDWAAAETLEEAVAYYKRIYGVDDDQIDDPWELGDEELDRLQFHFTDDDGVHTTGVVMSFRDTLAKMIADGEQFPCHFASTEQ